MGIPTILIDLIPSYETIGYWAAVLLVLMRFLQRGRGRRRMGEARS